MKTKLVNGRIYSPENGIDLTGDLLIEDGIVQAIGSVPAEADEVIDCAGGIIAPSVIDLHVHVYPGKTPLGISADEIGVGKGVSIVVDAGSAGAENYGDFDSQIIKKVKTKIYSFINYSFIGLKNGAGELADRINFNEERLIEAIEQYKDSIIGIKLRASGSVVGELGIEPIQKGVAFAHRVGLPVMIHVGNAPPALEEVLPLLKKGDIITHIFHGKPGGILDEAGNVKAIVHEKYKEGVIYDVGHGSASFNIHTAKKGIAQGIIPYTVSTDLHTGNYPHALTGMAEVMTKCHIAGMEEEDILKGVISHPARIIGIENVIAEGKPASITIIDKINKPFVSADAQGNETKADWQYGLRLCK